MWWVLMGFVVGVVDFPGDRVSAVPSPSASWGQGTSVDVACVGGVVFLLSTWGLPWSHCKFLQAVVAFSSHARI